MRSTLKLLNSDAVCVCLALMLLSDRLDFGLFCTICLQQNSISARWCKYNDSSVFLVTSVVGRPIKCLAEFLFVERKRCHSD